MSTIEIIRPDDIEKRSFEIIEERLKAQNISVPFDLPEKDKEQAPLIKSIVYRCIHTTADLDYATTLEFSYGAAGILRELISGGADIITDTNMALTGINKNKLREFGGRVHCFMADSDVCRYAKEKGTTRAYASMKKAYSLTGLHNIFTDGEESGILPDIPMDVEDTSDDKLCKHVIYAIGNAPTALLCLHNMYLEEGYKPDFIIGVPVGFVNVVQSKELIMSTDIPYIINRGNKGGSTVAAAIINAVLYSL